MAPTALVAANKPITLPAPVLGKTVATAAAAGVAGGVTEGGVVIKLTGFSQFAPVATISLPFWVKVIATLTVKFWSAAKVCFCPITLLPPHLIHQRLEFINVLKAAVNAGKAHVGDFVER